MLFTEEEQGNSMRWFLLVYAVAIIAVLPVASQSVTGTLVGTVTDNSGGVVAGPKCRLAASKRA
jgi:hypothetical protein